MMHLAWMPGCCKARVLWNFGGGEVGDGVRRWKKEQYDKNRKHALSLIRAAKRDKIKLVYANTVDTQPSAEKMLVSLGFYQQPNKIEVVSWNDKVRYLTGWILPVDELTP